MTQQPPTFPTVTIAGVGLIGGSLGLAAKRAGFDGKILGVSSPSSLEHARRAGAIDEGFPYDELVVAAARSDLVVLAAPILTIIEHLELLGRAGDRLRPGTIITDVGSTKRAIVAAAARVLPPSIAFIGGHPLAGSEQRGAAAADPFLFQNAYYVLTPGERAGDDAVERLAAFLGLTGARVIVLPAAEHDRVAAAISHLPQLLAVHLVNYLESLGPLRDTAKRLAAGGFRDMTRIASSSFRVWDDILSTNRDEVIATVESFGKFLAAGTAGLDPAMLAEAFEHAALTRGEIPIDTRGFLSRLWDVLVEVEDRPGMILDLVQPLTAKGINIKDIEVLKVREGEGGTMRLAFATIEEAREAILELERRSFRARLRS